MVVVSIAEQPRTATRLALSALRRGEIIVFPTDTVYGIGGDALRLSVHRRVQALKAREARKAFPLLVSSLAMAERYVRFTLDQRAYARRMWPGATTIVLPRRKGRGTLAVRVPKHPWLRRLIAHFGKPLIGTSANVSGKNPATSARMAKTYFPSVAVIVDGGRCAGKPSQVVRFSRNALKILRHR